MNPQDGEQAQAIAEMNALFAQANPPTSMANEQQERSSDALLHDRFDGNTYAQTRAVFNPLQQASTDRRLLAASTFAENAFMAFYKPVPMLRSDEQLTLTATLHKRLLAEMMQTAEYHNVRAAGSASDPYSSAIAAAGVLLTLGERLERKTGQQLRTLEHTEQQAQQLQQQRENLMKLAMHAEGEGQQQLAQQLRQQAQQLQQQAAARQRQAQSLFERIDDASESLEDTVRRASRQALQQAEQEIATLSHAMDTFTALGEGVGTGVATRMANVREKIKLARYLTRNKKLALIAELAGHMKSAALEKQKQRVLHPPDEVIGMEMGNELARMMTSEFYLLSDDLLELLFYQKYVDHGLLQWEMRGHEPEIKGPIICILDGSGSMDSVLTGSGETAITKEIWSKAVAIGGLLTVARKQHRDFALMQFGAPGDLQTFHFPKGQGSMEQIIEAASFFFDSGDTVYEDWMREALKLAEQSEYAKADLVIITDGLTTIAQEALARYTQARTTRQMHAQGIILARPASLRKGLAALEAVVDTDKAGKARIVTLSDLNEDAEALELLFSL